MGQIQEILSDVARSQIKEKSPQLHSEDRRFLSIPIWPCMKWPLAKQNNIPAKPTQMFCEQTSFYRTREKLGPMCMSMQSSEPLHRTCHPNGCIPQKQSFSCLLAIFISPPFMYNFNFQKFCPGPFTGLHCFTRSELPSLRAPHCLLWPCPSCFFVKDPHLRMCVSMSHKTNAHLIYRLARKHSFPGQFTKSSSPGPKSPTNSLLQLQFTEFIIVLGGALQSNQNDNNS